eukprot:GHVU01218314.1.p1 GENE.GHVU01218314.1~~GHVU01218314.1.p1  ORF type:complete len:634 (-),score=96.47 GHVU01218314.1:647-2548(-)
MDPAALPRSAVVVPRTLFAPATVFNSNGSEVDMGAASDDDVDAPTGSAVNEVAEHAAATREDEWAWETDSEGDVAVEELFEAQDDEVEPASEADEESAEEVDASEQDDMDADDAALPVAPLVAPTSDVEMPPDAFDDTFYDLGVNDGGDDPFLRGDGIEWFLNILSIITDQGSNVTKAFAHYKGTWCICHVIHNVVLGLCKNVLFNVPLVRAIAFVRHILKSVSAGNAMREMQLLSKTREAKPQKHVKTRWTSLHTLVAWMIENEQAVSYYFCTRIQGWRSRQEAARVKRRMRLTKSRWDHLRQLLTALAPLNDLSVALQATEQPAMQLVLPLLKHTMRQLEDLRDANTGSAFADAIQDTMDDLISRLQFPKETVRRLCAATLFAPCFKAKFRDFPEVEPGLNRTVCEQYFKELYYERYHGLVNGEGPLAAPATVQPQQSTTPGATASTQGVEVEVEVEVIQGGTFTTHIPAAIAQGAATSITSAAPGSQVTTQGQASGRLPAQPMAPSAGARQRPSLAEQMGYTQTPAAVRDEAVEYLSEVVPSAQGTLGFDGKELLQHLHDSQSRFPKLTLMAMEILAMPPTTAGAERRFHKVGRSREKYQRRTKERTLQLRTNVAINWSLVDSARKLHEY